MNDQRKVELHLALDLWHVSGEMHLCCLREEVIEGGGHFLLTALLILHLHHKQTNHYTVQVSLQHHRTIHFTGWSFLDDSSCVKVTGTECKVTGSTYRNLRILLTLYVIIAVCFFSWFRYNISFHFRVSGAADLVVFSRHCHLRNVLFLENFPPPLAQIWRL